MDNKKQSPYQQSKNVFEKKKDNSKTPRHYLRRSPNSSQPNAHELRYVFAAYFNMARANLYNVLQHISVQTGLAVNKDEEHMDQLPVARFANHKHPEVRQKVYTLLYKYIPCLKQMAQAYITKHKPAKNGKPAIEEHKIVTQSDLQALLQNIIRVINYQRNDFTHANHYNTLDEINDEYKREADLFRPMSFAFMGSKREVTRVFKYTAEEMFFVNQNERMEKTNEFDENGKPIYQEYSDWYFRLFTKGPKFIHNAQGDLEISESEEKDTLQLTTAGLTFLLCKFLHKKYATQLSQQTGLFRTKNKSGHSPFLDYENEIMFNIFCAHRIRLPKGRIESTTDRYALGLDMLNELQKCPKELFDTLSPEDRKLFQVTHNDDNKLIEPDDNINPFRRNGDRFTQLVLKYIDSNRNFYSDNVDDTNIPLPNIVFQIALGKYRYKFYEHASLDTSEKERVRVLQKEINGFGPISKIEELRDGKKFSDGNENGNDTVGQNIGQYSSIIRRVSTNQNQLYEPDTAQTKPYLTDHTASYSITGNRIGLMWGTTNNNGILNPDTLCYLPKLPEPVRDEKGSWFVDKTTIDKNVPPRAWLSIHDLPALIFLHLIGGKPEEVIKSTYKSLKKFFTDIQKGKLRPIFNGQLKTIKKIRDKQINDLKASLATLIEKKYIGLKFNDLPDKIIEYLILGNVYTNNPNYTSDQFNVWVERQLNGHPEERNSQGHIILQKRDGIIKCLENDIHQFNESLKIVGDNKQNRLGRKGYVDIRPGSLARYLSKDIVSLTIPDSKEKNCGKPTGLNFAVLQASIATFVSDGIVLKDTQLGKILCKAIDVSKHPFLSKILENKVKDTIDFYKKYQKSKLEWLKKCRENKDYLSNSYFYNYIREGYRNHMVKDAEHVLSKEGNNQSHVKGLAERYLETLQLPDGLFTDAIRAQLEINENTKDNEYIKAALTDKIKGHSAAYLIYVYFTRVLNDMSQPFYGNQQEQFKRNYKLLDTIYHNNSGCMYLTENEIAHKLKKGDTEKSEIRHSIESYLEELKIKIGTKRDSNNPHKKTPIYRVANEKEREDERRKLMHQLRDLQRNEKTIRRFRNEDMLLFLMAKKLLLSDDTVFKGVKGVDGIQKFQLQDIMPPAFKTDDSKSLLEIPIEFSLTIGLKDEKWKPITDEKGKQIYRTIHQKEIKIKNYGDFFSFLYDCRIGGLLSQLQLDKPIERVDLENELDSYDRRRIKVFKILQAIECRIIKEHPELTDCTSEGFRDSSGKPYLNSFRGLLSLCKKYVIAENQLSDKACSIVDIRNAFSHNHYRISNNKNINISEMTLPHVAKKIIEWLENNQ